MQNPTSSIKGRFTLLTKRVETSKRIESSSKGELSFYLLRAFKTPLYFLSCCFAFLSSKILFANIYANAFSMLVT